MSNRETLETSFRLGLSLPAQSAVTSLEYGGTQEWDSVAHMQLIVAIEDAFDVMLETEDVIGMSSFVLAMEILRRNHGIEFDA